MESTAVPASVSMFFKISDNTLATTLCFHRSTLHFVWIYCLLVLNQRDFSGKLLFHRVLSSRCCVANLSSYESMVCATIVCDLSRVICQTVLRCCNHRMKAGGDRRTWLLI
uniref:Uncharacterized protein n=1 Tax=Arundo donax TaxID=35708 RepID=A0A0A9BCP2_ARUDO